MDLISIGWLLGKVKLNPKAVTDPRVFPGKVPDHCRSTEFGPNLNWCKGLVVFEAAICMIVLALLQEQVFGFLPKNSKKSAPSQIPGHKVRRNYAPVPCIIDAAYLDPDTLCPLVIATGQVCGIEDSVPLIFNWHKKSTLGIPSIIDGKSDIVLIPSPMEMLMKVISRVSVHHLLKRMTPCRIGWYTMPKKDWP